MQFSVIALALLSAVASGAVLPRETADCPTESQDNSQPQTQCGAKSFTNHKVVSGETLTSIAKQYNSGICDIAKVNKIENPNYITPGQELSIPVDCDPKLKDDTSCFKKPAEPTETCVKGVGSTYDVRKGDTLTAIANNFNITLPALEGANPQIKNFDAIDVGQIINVPICQYSQCDSVGTYIIQKGDLFYDLAQKYYTTVGQIESLNVGVDPTTLPIGATIILPKNCHNLTSAVA